MFKHLCGYLRNCRLSPFKSPGQCHLDTDYTLLFNTPTHKQWTFVKTENMKDISIDKCVASGKKGPFG